jgi:hypothetical protein
MSRNELNMLLEFLVEFAQLMLHEQREFYPFGAGLSPTGEIISAGADAGPEHPRSQELIELLFSGKVVPPGSTATTDAICVELQHRT